MWRRDMHLSLSFVVLRRHQFIATMAMHHCHCQCHLGVTYFLHEGDHEGGAHHRELQ